MISMDYSNQIIRRALTISKPKYITCYDLQLSLNPCSWFNIDTQLF